MNIDNNIYVPTDVRSKVLDSVKNKVRTVFYEKISFNFKIRESLDKHKVQSFFEARSIKNNFKDFTESTSNWYMSILDESKYIRQILNQENVKICDIGCGRGGLIEWLDEHGSNYQYTGFDIDRVAVLKCEKKYASRNNVRFYAQDTEDIKPTIIGHQDCVFTINVLPYVDNMEDYFESVKQIITPQKTYLVVIDPIPSFYWNDTFGGFAIKIRPPKDLIKHFTSAGFQLEECIKLNGFNFLQIPLIGICSLTIWRLT